MGADDYSAGKARRSAMALERAARRHREAQAAEGGGSVVDVDRHAEAVGAVLLRLLGIGGGWVRLVPDEDLIVWCKWRYTSGRWAGHYSLARWDPQQSDLADALEALERKVIGAMAPVPTHKPTPDRY